MEPLEVRTLLAGEFTDLGAIGLTGVDASAVAWGDMDNDGDLDVLLTGRDSTDALIARVYRNNGNSTFTDLNAGLTGVNYSAVAWGDFDNDSDLDLILAGRDSSNTSITKVYRNNGNSSFTDLNAGLTGIGDGSVAWGDMDNDGDLDLLLTGSTSQSSGISKVYRNNGNSTFTDLNVGLIGGREGSSAWGDYDNDGDLDILQAVDTGTVGLNAFTNIYRNNGNSTFTNLSAGLTEFAFGAVAWGDYDSDGDLDIVLTGYTGNNGPVSRSTTIYRNNGNSTFTDLNAGLAGLSKGSAAWGDYDNDGDLDILVTGRDAAGTRLAKFYRNNGDGTFAELNAGISGVAVYSSVAWGDSDNDGDLDLLVTGQDSMGARIAKVYRNNSLIANAPPAAPTGLTVTTVSPSVMMFSWTAPSDAETPLTGLSYNLRVGTTPGGNEVFSSMSSAANGKRRIVSAGPIQGTSLTLNGLNSSQTYYWSVQAIDSGFAGSPFATEQTARVPFLELGSLGNGVVSGTNVWGDYDNDGDQDLLITGFDVNVGRIAKVYRNNGNNSFTDLNAGLAGVTDSSAAWGDADNDGDLDILITGQDSTNTRIAKFYRNNGNSTFTDVNSGLTGVYRGSVAWGDMDNDGDLDILLTGQVSLGVHIAKIFRNNGNNTFTDSNAGLTGVADSSVAWGDVDNDGDLDILLAGNDSTYARIAKVYRNNGDSTFTGLNAGLTGIARGSVAWGDADNDGDLDVLLAGADSLNSRIAKVYRNNGNSTFSDFNASLTSVRDSSVAWGDYDNDGDLDILLTGQDSLNARITKIYRNDGSGTFEDAKIKLFGGVVGSAAWGDCDNDGDLDFIVSGQDAGGNRITKIFQNNLQAVNTPPAAPTNLAASSASRTSLTFAWIASADGQTPSGGLSYNLRVGTTPGASNVFSTMASAVNGKRRLPDSGPIQGTSFTLNGLTFGQTYYWSVQAIDTAFAGGAFAVEQSATPSTNNAPSLGNVLANQSVNDNATISPFAALTVTDPDNQNMFARVTIFNGVFRGDFLPASVTGWTRTVSGNDIRYERFYSPQANIGGVVQAAVRAFVFQPRTNAIKPNTTELTDITLFVNDGLANATAATRLTTTSVNNAPAIANPSNTVMVNDNATVNPFPTLTVNDADMQEMLISVTILNGTARGDFTPASTAGWAVRYVLGNNITYKRYFGPQANVGAAAQAAFRALVFQPRQNAINPGTTELTDFQVTVSDGVAPAIANTGSRVTTTSVNNAPTIGGAVANQTMNDNQTKTAFSTLTVTDPDTQGILARVTITNGTTRGDFTSASAAGWTRSVSGTNIIYNRYFNPAANNGAVVQAAVRALVFQPRNNVPLATTETTSFTIFVNDGLANVTNSTTSVITTGVAPRPAPSAPALPPLILDGDITTVVLPSARKHTINPLARLLRKSR